MCGKATFQRFAICGLLLSQIASDSVARYHLRSGLVTRLLSFWNAAESFRLEQFGKKVFTKSSEFEKVTLNGRANSEVARSEAIPMGTLVKSLNSARLWIKTSDWTGGSWWKLIGALASTSGLTADHLLVRNQSNDQILVFYLFKIPELYHSNFKFQTLNSLNCKASSFTRPLVFTWREAHSLWLIDTRMRFICEVRRAPE